MADCPFWQQDIDDIGGKLAKESISEQELRARQSRSVESWLVGSPAVPIFLPLALQLAVDRRSPIYKSASDMLTACKLSSCLSSRKASLVQKRLS